MEIRSATLITTALLFAAGPVVAEGIYEKAVREYREGNFSAVKEMLGKKSPKAPGDYNLLGWASVRTGDYDSAIKSFSSAVLMDKGDRNSHCGLGHSHLATGRTEKALEAFILGGDDQDCQSGLRALGAGPWRKVMEKDPAETTNFVFRADGGSFSVAVNNGRPERFFALFLLMAVLVGIFFSVAAILLEELSYRRYQRLRDVFTLIFYGVFENLGYRQLLAVWRTQAVLGFLFTRENKWEVVKMNGFDGASKAGRAA